MVYCIAPEHLDVCDASRSPTACPLQPCCSSFSQPLRDTIFPFCSQCCTWERWYWHYSRLSQGTAVATMRMVPSPPVWSFWVTPADPGMCLHGAYGTSSTQLWAQHPPVNINSIVSRNLREAWWKLRSILNASIGKLNFKQSLTCY